MTEFYYNFYAVGLDDFDIKEIRKYSRRLNDLSELSARFEQLRSSYENMSKERADIAVYACPPVSGVASVSAFNYLRRGLFSKKIKRHCISLCVTKEEEDGSLSLYFYGAQDFNFVKELFRGFIEQNKIPDFDGWEREVF